MIENWPFDSAIGVRNPVFDIWALFASDHLSFSPSLPSLLLVGVPEFYSDLEFTDEEEL